jgi:uroporphyrinogen decarboxylase
MTSKERMDSAMHLKEPDRIPLMCQLSIGYLLLNTGISPIEFSFTNEGAAKAFLKGRESCSFDGILIDSPGRDPNWKKRVKKIENNSEGQIIYWKDDSRTICPYDDGPKYCLLKKQNYPTLAEVNPDKIEVPEEFPEYMFGIIDTVLEEAGEKFSVHGEVVSPFSQFICTFGMENALIYLIDDSKKCKEIISRCAERALSWGAAQVKRGIHALKISSAYAGSSFISRDFYKEFVLPYEGYVATKIQQMDVPVYLHTCGFIGDRLELMIEGGAQGIECLDPPPLGNGDLENAKRRIGSKSFIKGNIDSVNVLLRKNIDEVIEVAKQCISAGAPGGGYILSTACSTAPHVPPKNMEALIGAVERYGRY